jgi:hypothetical protein
VQIRDVRFSPESGHAERQHRRPLSARSGHQRKSLERRPLRDSTWLCLLRLDGKERSLVTSCWRPAHAHLSMVSPAFATPPSSGGESGLMTNRLSTRLDRLERCARAQGKRQIYCEAPLGAIEAERERFLREAVPNLSDSDLVVWIARLSEDTPPRLISIT